jgi:hypothetical protein
LEIIWLELFFYQDRFPICFLPTFVTFWAAFAQLAAACTVVALVGSRLPVFWRRADAEQRSHAPTRAAAIGMGVTLKIAAEEPLLSVTFSPATNFWGNKRQTFDNFEDF